MTRRAWVLFWLRHGVADRLHGEIPNAPKELCGLPMYNWRIVQVRLFSIVLGKMPPFETEVVVID